MGQNNNQEMVEKTIRGKRITEFQASQIAEAVIGDGRTHILNLRHGGYLYIRIEGDDVVMSLNFTVATWSVKFPAQNDDVDEYYRYSISLHEFDMRKFRSIYNKIIKKYLKSIEILD